MLNILMNVLLSMSGGILAAAGIGWVAWKLLSWTPFPGMGPVIAFAGLALALHSSPFTQMLLMFSGILAAGGFATLFAPVGNLKSPPPLLRNAVTTPKA